MSQFVEMESEGKTLPMSLEERIAELEETIRGYDKEYKATTDKEEKRELRGLIKSARDNLQPLLLQQQRQEERQLLAQQQQTNRGNF